MTKARDQARSPVVVGMYAFSTPDPRRLAKFWAELMTLPIADGASDDLAMLDFEHDHGSVTWLFQRVDTDEAPTNRLGLDLDAGADYRAVADRAQSLGGARFDEHEQDGARWIEMRDPDGNPFRIFAPRPGS